MDKQKRIEETAVDLSCSVDLWIDYQSKQYSLDYTSTAENLINAGYGNLKEFGEQILNLVSCEMESLKKCEDNLEQEGNHDGAVLHQVRYWELHRLREKIEKLIKEYME